MPESFLMIPCSGLFGGWEVSCQQEFIIQRVAIYPIIMMKYGSVKFHAMQDGAGGLDLSQYYAGGPKFVWHYWTTLHNFNFTWFFHQISLMFSKWTPSFHQHSIQSIQLIKFLQFTQFNQFFNSSNSSQLIQGREGVQKKPVFLGLCPKL